VQQLVHPLVVLGDQVLDDQRARSNLVEHRAEGALAGVGAEQVVDLDQDRGRDDTPLARRFGEQLRAALVRLVVAVEGTDQDRRVEDQRDGRGSKTSSAASLLRSPRPELNAPMQVSDGCSPSSCALVRLSLPAPAISCSSASRTSSGTSTPRSRAARCARSRRSASISMLFFAVEATARRVASGSRVRVDRHAAEAPLRRPEAIVGTLIFAGPRAHEIGYMLERDIDLANTRIFVGRSKTAAGLREIRTLPILHDILAAHKARPAAGGPDVLAFATGTGGRRDRSNLRERVLAEVFERADKLLRERAEPPLPKGLSPHKLRHTFASIPVALGTDPAQVCARLAIAPAARPQRKDPRLDRLTQTSTGP